MRLKFAVYREQKVDNMKLQMRKVGTRLSGRGNSNFHGTRLENHLDDEVGSDQ